MPWDSYIVNRVDIQRGPNSILFGLGSPAGVINSNLVRATFQDENEVELRIGEHGTIRGSLDVNKVLIEDELAIRFAYLNEQENFQQDPAFEDDERIFATFQYAPKALKSDNHSLTRPLSAPVRGTISPRL